MSTKKDKFTSRDKDYMKLALNLAWSRNGLTGENPSVGCVIVKNNKVISIGQTGINGRPHAEYNAIKHSYENLKDSKMYVTLEPCNHYGKTPPCTNEIINSGINEVFYCIQDIDKRVKGKSLQILAKNKIKVQNGLLHAEAKNLYNAYTINRIKKLPYVTGKIAISKNNLIYSKGTKNITDDISNRLTHYLRYKNDAIMISSKTLNIDNPRLSCRLHGFEKFSPKRVVLDKDLEIKLTSFIFKSAKKNNTIIIHDSKNLSKINILKRKGIKLINFKLNNKKYFDLKKILKYLYTLDIRHLLVEGGDKITKNFLRNKLINKFYLFKSPKKLSKAKNFLSFTGLSILSKKNIFKYKISSKLAKDTITIYKR